MDIRYIKAKELSARWGVTPRRINQLCTEGKLPGAYKEGKFWMIPDDVDRPDCLRENRNLYVREDSVVYNRKRPCPVGITSYKEVSNECYYVDKTLLIRDIIDNHSKVYLFTRPRRFGKTLTMDMVRTFFEKTDTDTSIYFKDKYIWRAGAAYKEKQGQYPVIFLTFKDAHQSTWQDMYASLCFTLRNEFLRHIELMTSARLSDYDKKYLKSILDDEATIIDYQFALGKLSAMLSKHYGRNVIVIIDEYDTPIQQGHIFGYYDEVIGFMRNLLSAVLKDNPSLELGILTGILRIAKESLFSGLNNLVVNTILDDEYSQYFGFTEEEVSAMAQYYGVSDRLGEIKEWYDGYMFGRTGIYNPWSVINYFNNKCVPKAFWSRTSGNEIIGELFNSADTTFADNLLRLLQGSTVQAIVDTDIIYPEINGDIDTIYSFLLVAGYLRVSEHIGSLYDNPICALSIPNYEIKSVFQKEIIDRYNGIFTGALLRNFAESIRTGNAHLLTETLQQYFLQSASVFDTAHEDFYHGVVFGMLAVLSDNYYISSNRESGEGRFDIELQPKSRGGHGYIIEFKACKEAELEKMAGSAVRQIQQKSYTANLEKHGVSGIGMFGVAFSGKKVSVAYEEHDVKKRKSRE
ncbi:MAG: AAA family ATPase [Lachnospira eligens]